jgi:hypothetical protein
MARFEVSIISHKYPREKIKTILTEWDSSWQAHEQDIGIQTRGIDPTVLVAIVGATGTAIGGLIAGLFQLVSGRKDEKIVLKSSKGATIEFPASLSSQKLDELILKLNQLEEDKYQIFLP